MAIDLLITFMINSNEFGKTFVLKLISKNEDDNFYKNVYKFSLIDFKQINKTWISREYTEVIFVIIISSSIQISLTDALHSQLTTSKNTIKLI
jgi:hypothetical protein